MSGKTNHAALVVRADALRADTPESHHSFWMRWFRSVPLGFGLGTVASVAH